MRPSRAQLALLALAFAVSVSAQRVACGGGPLPMAARDGLLPEERVALRAAVQRTRARAAGSGDLQPYPFLPQGGTAYGDLFFANFVDLDPTPGLLDWECTQITYDGHQGVDSSIRSFAEQDAGVPVFAALDGTVVGFHDGEPDHNTRGAKVPSNWVALRHGGDQYSVYVHFRRGSVAVSLGQQVAAGTQLGFTASSGYSYWPHLHLESWDYDEVYEPSAGPCRPGPSYWAQQVPIRRDTWIWDFNVSDALLEEYPGLPWDMPRTGSFPLGQQEVSFWVHVLNLPEDSAWSVRYFRPDGSLVLEDAGGFGNPFWLGAWWWWRHDLLLDQAGAWRIQLEVNGEPLMDAPFAVYTGPDAPANRPPQAVSATLEPPVPREGDVPRCRITPPPPPGDPDYDLVLYRYEWTVNGAPARSGTFAGTLDALRRDAVRAGDTVCCTVTPTDGSADGPDVTLSARVFGAAPLAPIAAAHPSSGPAPLTVTFEGFVAGGKPPYGVLWGFGDGSSSSEPNPVHTYGRPGAFSASLTATDSAGEVASAPPLAIRVGPAPPTVSSVTPLADPFRLRLEGANFQEGIQVDVGGLAWPSATRKSESRLFLRGGRALKEAFPGGVPVDVLLTNPDGGSVSFTYTRP